MQNICTRQMLGKYFISAQFLWSVPAQDQDLYVFFILQNVLLMLWVYNNKTICSFEWCILLPLWGNFMVYLNFPLLLRKMQVIPLQVISLAPPYPSTRLQLPLLAQTIGYLSHIYLLIFCIYIVKCIKFYMAQIVFIWEG